MEIILVIILTISMQILGQQMRPGIIVSKDNGVVNAKDVYFGYLDCNNSDLESSQYLRDQIQKLQVKFENLSAEVQRIGNQIQYGMDFTFLCIVFINIRRHPNP